MSPDTCLHVFASSSATAGTCTGRAAAMGAAAKSMPARAQASIEAPIARRMLADGRARKEISTSRGFQAIVFPLYEPAVVATAWLLVQRLPKKADKEPRGPIS